MQILLYFCRQSASNCVVDILKLLDFRLYYCSIRCCTLLTNFAIFLPAFCQQHCTCQILYHICSFSADRICSQDFAVFWLSRIHCFLRLHTEYYFQIDARKICPDLCKPDKRDKCGLPHTVHVSRGRSVFLEDEGGKGEESGIPPPLPHAGSLFCYALRPLLARR